MRRLMILMLAVVIFFSCSVLTITQDKPPNVIIIYFFKVKAGMAQQFESAMKTHLEWLVEAGGEWPWNTWLVVTGERCGDYLLTSAFHTWAEFDDYEEFLNKEIQNFQFHCGEYIESIECLIDEADFAHARFPTPMDFGYINVVEMYKYDLKPSRTADFFESRSKIHQAIVLADWLVYFYWETVRSGGKMPGEWLIVFHKNWAGMQGPEKSLLEVLSEAYGAEEAQTIIQQFYGSINSVESSVGKYLPYLSYNAGKIGWRQQP